MLPTDDTPFGQWRVPATGHSVETRLKYPQKKHPAENQRSLVVEAPGAKELEHSDVDNTTPKPSTMRPPPAAINTSRLAPCSHTTRDAALTIEADGSVLLAARRGRGSKGLIRVSGDGQICIELLPIGAAHPHSPRITATGGDALVVIF